MLISQEAQGGAPPSKGRERGHLAELRRQLAKPSSLSDGNRHRLRELSARLARVQALGGEYGRVGLSQPATAALRSDGAEGGGRGPVAVA
jgi:hypothetical protein